ncbi:zinc finger protein 184-like [Coccinella septempunctata]|uniref:zinc finger protein 184-like n=1 Tax=Coccinella septempunctata TaxID=41139 RepID=UPI001D08248C|nr:zinc finger protein 184-like [Coccinella septempunctata]
MSQTEMGIYARCCRLCLSENKETLKCEESDRGVVLRERILAFLSIDIKQNDALSKLVCEDCSQRVNDWCEFKKNCQRNQTTLESWAKDGAEVSTVQVKEEVIEDDTPADDDDIEILTDNITVKTEPVDFEHYDASMTNGTSEHSEDVGEAARVEVAEHEKEAQETGAPVALAERRFSEHSHSEKIIFAAGLKLIKSDATPIEMENLSPLESSYIEKCKAMVDMYRSLKCACHMATHPNLKGLLSHLRSVKIWFPVFTCYNCMITFTDRSSSGKHIHKCPNKNLDTLVKLSNLKKRSNLKTRIYQNYRCINCRFIFAFHEDFCKHVDEEHCNEIAPYSCTCTQTFDSMEDYKDHIYVSCMVEYYCDICNIAVRTLKEFINHAQHQHDNSEGFSLLQEDNYKKRTFHKVEPRENKEILGKRRSSTYGRAPTADHDNEDQVPSPKYSRSSRNVPTKCPQCDKVYSCQANMLRHFRTHQDEVKQEKPDPDALENSYYRCPDCQIMYNAVDWEAHKEAHEKIKCTECDKVFLFKTELEQHRGVHLNLKVYRDSKTDSYKSTMLSPNPELPICDVCNILCENFEDLESHKLSHEDLDDEGVPLELSKYSCSTCNKHFASYGEYSDHNLKLHADRQISNSAYPRQCDECDKVVTSGSAFASHKAMHRRLRAETARISRPASPVDRPKSRKSGNQEGEDYHTCKRCFKVFSSRYNLKMHMKLHGINLTTGRTSKSPKKFHCDRCDITFANNDALNSHIDEEHDDMPELEEDFNHGPYIFTCDVCVQTFSNKTALIQHKSKHHSQEAGPSNSEISFVTYCKYCKIGFDKMEDLDAHMIQAHSVVPVPSKSPKVVNNANKGFNCKICNKSFSSQPAMYAHQGWHKRTSNEGPLNTQPKKQAVKPRRAEFECNVCGQELPNDIALRIHTIEKHGNAAALLNPRCEPCDQDFGTQTEYENHMKLHEIVENQKKQKVSFGCQLCPASFSKGETLQAHIKISHPTYPQEFKCPHCGRIFDKQASLTNHVKVHEKQKVVVGTSKPLYFCSICSMGFNVPKDLRTHTITAHPF